MKSIFLNLLTQKKLYKMELPDIGKTQRINIQKNDNIE